MVNLVFFSVFSIVAVITAIGACRDRKLSGQMLLRSMVVMGALIMAAGNLATWAVHSGRSLGLRDYGEVIVNVGIGVYGVGFIGFLLTRARSN